MIMSEDASWGESACRGRAEERRRRGMAEKAPPGSRNFRPGPGCAGLGADGAGVAKAPISRTVLLNPSGGVGCLDSSEHLCAVATERLDAMWEAGWWDLTWPTDEKIQKLVLELCMAHPTITQEAAKSALHPTWLAGVETQILGRWTERTATRAMVAGASAGGGAEHAEAGGGAENAEAVPPEVGGHSLAQPPSVRPSHISLEEIMMLRELLSRDNVEDSRKSDLLMQVKPAKSSFQWGCALIFPLACSCAGHAASNLAPPVHRAGVRDDNAPGLVSTR